MDFGRLNKNFSTSPSCHVGDADTLMFTGWNLSVYVPVIFLCFFILIGAASVVLGAFLGAIAHLFVVFSF